MYVADPDVLTLNYNCLTNLYGQSNANYILANCNEPEHKGYYEGLWEMFFDESGEYYSLPVIE